MTPRDPPRRERLRVLQLLGNAVVGGMETSVVRLAGDLRDAGVDVLALCPFESAITAALRACGCDVRIAAVPNDPSWTTLRDVAEWVASEDVDVLHAHLANAHVLGALVGALTGRACLATLHGLAIPMLDFEAHRFGPHMHVAVVCRSALAHARAIGVPPSRLHYLPNGVPPVPAPPERSLHALAGLPPDTPLVGFVGRLAPEKGPERFVRLAFALRRVRPDARFVMLGEGPLASSLEARARELGVADRVTLLGARSDAPALMAGLDVLVMPSLAEGLPLVLLEAMAAGIAIVASPVGAVPEQIEHGRTGMLVDAGDVAELAAVTADLLADAHRRRAHGEAAHRAAQAGLSQHAASEATIGVYRRLVRAPAGIAGEGARYASAGLNRA